MNKKNKYIFPVLLLTILSGCYASKNDFQYLLDHPLFIALVSVLIGSGLFGYLTYLRSKRDTIKNKAIEFLEDVSNDFNDVLLLIYSFIKSKNDGKELSTTHYESLEKAIYRLFSKRMNVRVKSEAYLKNSNFWKIYDKSAWAIMDTKEVIKCISNVSEPSDIITIIDTYNLDLANYMKIDINELEPIEVDKNLSSPYYELMIRMRIVWNTICKLLSDEIIRNI